MISLSSLFNYMVSCIQKFGLRIFSLLLIRFKQITLANFQVFLSKPSQKYRFKTCALVSYLNITVARHKFKFQKGMPALQNKNDYFLGPKTALSQFQTKASQNSYLYIISKLIKKILLSFTLYKLLRRSTLSGQKRIVFVFLLDVSRLNQNYSLSPLFQKIGRDLKNINLSLRLGNLKIQPCRFAQFVSNQQSKIGSFEAPLLLLPHEEISRMMFRQNSSSKAGQKR